MREYETAKALAARALELSEQHQFSNVCRPVPMFSWSGARSRWAKRPSAYAPIRQGIDRIREIGTPLGINAFTAYLAKAQARADAIAHALETVEEDLQTNSDELFYRPETLRLRGELRLKQGQTELAESGFREAIAPARRMGAKAWELRETTNLVEMLAKQRRRDEPRAMLAEIYSWFTEGFDTTDLKDAKALLDQLAAQS